MRAQNSSQRSQWDRPTVEPPRARGGSLRLDAGDRARGRHRQRSVARRRACRSRVDRRPCAGGGAAARRSTALAGVADGRRSTPARSQRDARRRSPGPPVSADVPAGRATAVARAAPWLPADAGAPSGASATDRARRRPTRRRSAGCARPATSPGTARSRPSPSRCRRRPIASSSSAARRTVAARPGPPASAAGARAAPSRRSGRIRVALPTALAGPIRRRRPRQPPARSPSRDRLRAVVQLAHPVDRPRSAPPPRLAASSPGREELGEPAVGLEVAPDHDRVVRLERLRDPIDQRPREPERVAHLADRRARPVRDEVADHPRVLRPVAPVDVLDDLLAALRAEVDVDVRVGRPALVDEPLEQEVVARSARPG